MTSQLLGGGANEPKSHQKCEIKWVGGKKIKEILQNSFLGYDKNSTR